MYGTAWVTCASQEIPAIREREDEPWITSSWRALMPSGGRSALTALDTASIPVSEEPPLANARPQEEDGAKVSRPLVLVPGRLPSRRAR